MIFNEQNQPSTPYKKKQMGKSHSFTLTDFSHSNSMHSSKINIEEAKENIIVAGNIIQPEFLFNGGSFFDCYIGINHSKDCNFELIVDSLDSDAEIKEKLSKFICTKEIPNKFRQNFVKFKCLTINKEIKLCINCKDCICIECLEQCSIETNGCTPICVLKNKRKIPNDFTSTIKKISSVKNHLAKIEYASLKGSQFTIQMPFYLLSLEDILAYANLNNKKLKKELIDKIILHVAKGIQQLNKLNLIHNDIKPENILFDSIQKQFILCDFNVSQEPGLIKLDGNRKYMAKEVLDDYCCFKSDVYSLGLLYFEMSQELDDFTKSMMNDRVKNRPSIEDVILYFTKNDNVY
ncbi:serine/threonine protein kinase [Anncaliia algerae PRA339]|uniref:Serine/threonine protein kinase n=1 Tax=Anncaliia algerae PRA339 TaxID=1288291 RepID=A0A059F181_9MICR|nr:serine/threonine protein kinase [Anncaliia algerae PRA339]